MERGKERSRNKVDFFFFFYKKKMEVHVNDMHEDCEPLQYLSLWLHGVPHKCLKFSISITVGLSLDLHGGISMGVVPSFLHSCAHS